MEEKNKTKCSFFGKINTMNKFLTQVTKEKELRTNIKN